MSNVVPLDNRVDHLWRAYLAARARAEASKDVRDGIAAGRAWAAFVREFLEPDFRQFLDAQPSRRINR